MYIYIIENAWSAEEYSKPVTVFCAILSAKTEAAGSTRNLLPSLSLFIYHICRQTSNIGRTKSHNLNVSRLALKLYFSNPLKPGAKLRMKM